MSEELDNLRVPPYTRVSASEMAAVIEANRGVHTGAISGVVGIPRRLGRPNRATWQDRLRIYDEEGPGFVGWVLDTKAMIGGLIPMVVQARQPDGTWGRTDDAIAHAAALMMSNEKQETPELVAGWYRAMESMGDLYAYFVEGPHGPNVVTAAVNQMEWDERDPNHLIAVIKSLPDQSKYSPDVERVDASLVMRSYQPSRYWPALATSPWIRAQADVERYIATRRSILRVLNSRIITNGVLHFHAKTTAPTVNVRTPGSTTASTVPTQVDDYIRMTTRAMQDDDDPASNAPFPTWGDKAPEWIEIGRLMDPAALDAERAALQAVGRAIMFPLQLLLDGPGSGNHWSDIFLNETFLAQDEAMTLGHVYRDITNGPYRRVLKALGLKFGAMVDPMKYRLWFDISEIASRPDDTAEVLDMYLAGLLGADAARARLNIGKGEAPTIQEMLELAAWSPTVRSRERSVHTLPGAPQANTTPRPTKGSVGAPLVSLTDQLNGIDIDLFERLDALANSTTQSIVVDAGRAAIDTLPANDPLRAILQGLPPEQVWSATPPGVRQMVDLTAVTQASIPPATNIANSHLAAAVAAVGVAFTQADLSPPSGLGGLVATGVAVFVAGLAMAIAMRLRESGPRTVTRWAPTAVARNAMAAATGAVPNRDPDGFLQTADGTWVGGEGPATGPISMGTVLREHPGYEVLYTWLHDDPNTDFFPHVELDGATYTRAERKNRLRNPNSFPAPVFFPGDHNGCKCVELVSLARLSG